MRKRITRQKGFTLTEVMVALVIFAIGFLGFAAMQVTVMKNRAFSKDYAKAVSYAQKKLEEFKNEDWDSLPSQPGSETPETGFTVSWPAATQNGNIKTVVVTVSWTRQDASHSVTLSTDVYSNPSF